MPGRGATRSGMRGARTRSTPATPVDQRADAVNQTPTRTATGPGTPPTRGRRPLAPNTNNSTVVGDDIEELSDGGQGETSTGTNTRTDAGRGTERFDYGNTQSQDQADGLIDDLIRRLTSQENASRRQQNASDQQLAAKERELDELRRRIASLTAAAPPSTVTTTAEVHWPANGDRGIIPPQHHDQRATGTPQGTILGPTIATPVVTPSQVTRTGNDLTGGTGAHGWPPVSSSQPGQRANISATAGPQQPIWTDQNSTDVYTYGPPGCQANAYNSPSGVQNDSATVGNENAEWHIAPGKEQAYIDSFRSKIKGIPIFDGKNGCSIGQFFAAVEALKNIDKRFPVRLFIEVARERMRDTALDFITRNTVLARTTDYNVFKIAVKNRYGHGSQISAKFALERAQRQKGETLACFADRLEQLASRIWEVPFNATLSERQKVEEEKDKRLREAFRLGVDMGLMTYLGAVAPRDINEMLAVAIDYESDVLVKTLRTKQGTLDIVKQENLGDSDASDTLGDQDQKPNKRMKLEDAKVATLESKPIVGKFQGKCYNCKKPGHKRRDCWANNNANNAGKTGKFNGLCYLCGKAGHKGAECWGAKGNSHPNSQQPNGQQFSQGFVRGRGRGGGRGRGRGSFNQNSQQNQGWENRRGGGNNRGRSYPYRYQSDNSPNYMNTGYNQNGSGADRGSQQNNTSGQTNVEPKN